MEETRLLGNMSVRECGTELSAPAERAGQGRPGAGRGAGGRDDDQTVGTTPACGKEAGGGGPS